MRVSFRMSLATTDWMDEIFLDTGGVSWRILTVKFRLYLVKLNDRIKIGCPILPTVQFCECVWGLCVNGGSLCPTTVLYQSLPMCNKTRPRYRSYEEPRLGKVLGTGGFGKKRSLVSLTCLSHVISCTS